VGRIEDIVISTVVFLVASLRNTGGTVFQGANSFTLCPSTLSLAHTHLFPYVARSLTTQVTASLSVLSPVKGRDLGQSVHCGAPFFLGNKLLRERLSALHIAITARRWALQASAQPAFLLWQSPTHHSHERSNKYSGRFIHTQRLSMAIRSI
jgi:hypothetical protein